MPIPLIPIAIGAGALSLGAVVHSGLKRKKWQKIHNDALSRLKTPAKSPRDQ